MIKRIGRSKAVQTALGYILAYYLRLITWVGRPVLEPADPVGHVVDNGPLIISMWHGQHFLLPAIFPGAFPLRAIVSRSGDGEINAVALRIFKIDPIRASGGQAAHHYLKRGGAKGFLEAIRSLRDGICVALTADVPKGPARVCGTGIVQMAKRSNRPIVPMAIATRFGFNLNTWDKATVNLPFGRYAMIVGDPIFVPGDADDDQLESSRLEVEAAMNAVTERAYDRAGAAK